MSTAITETNVGEKNVADDGNAPKLIAVGLLVVFSIVIVIYYATKPRCRQKGEVSAGLKRNGWILYTSPGCGFCDKQKALLGHRFLEGEGNVVDCGQTPPTGSGSHGNLAGQSRAAKGTTPQCGDSRIVGFPFWYSRKTGGIKIGLQNVGQLRDMAASPRSS